MLRVIGESILIALRSIRGQILRTSLTVLIIAFGIMSLVGMLTAIDVLKQSIDESFSFFGTNTFIISGGSGKIKAGRKRSRELPFKSIQYAQAILFKERFQFPSIISINSFLTATATIKHGNQKTTPNISIHGGDDKYLNTAGYNIEWGRNFSYSEAIQGAAVCIVGHEVNQQLSRGEQNLLDRDILVQGQHMRVIGILKKGGSGFNISRDRTVIIPVGFFRQHFAKSNASFNLNVKVTRSEWIQTAIDEATAVMRGIRSLKPGDSIDFEIMRSDTFLRIINDITAYLSVGAFVIAGITLIGAVVGLINILLVAVNERTREIGIRKAIGATQFHILLQFLIEALLICQLGGGLGIVAGIGIGNALTFIVGGAFVLPFKWIIVSVVVCMITGVAAGFGPAWRASRWNPIEALRYE